MTQGDFLFFIDNIVIAIFLILCYTEKNAILRSVIMKSKLSIFIIISILVLSLCGCSQTEETVITYTPSSETQQADTFFDTNNLE